jgi:hypothetical protein
LQFFGCDLKQEFPGTFFRFPLRTAKLAGVSEIKAQPYEVSERAVTQRESRYTAREPFEREPLHSEGAVREREPVESVP